MTVRSSIIKRIFNFKLTKESVFFSSYYDLHMNLIFYQVVIEICNVLFNLFYKV
jgi:hypothetical protein